MSAPVEPASAEPTRGDPRRRRRTLTAVAIVAALTLLGLVGAAWMGRHAGIRQDPHLDDFSVFVKTPKGFSDDARFQVELTWKLDPAEKPRPGRLGLRIGAEQTTERVGYGRFDKIDVVEEHDDDGARAITHAVEDGGAELHTAITFVQPIVHRYGWGTHWITAPWLVGTTKQPLEVYALVPDGISAPGFVCEDRASTGKRCKREARDGRLVLVPAGQQPDDFTFLFSVAFFLGLFTYASARRGWLDTLVQHGVVDPVDVASRWAPFTFRPPAGVRLPPDAQRRFRLHLALGLVAAVASIALFVGLAGGLSPLPMPFVTSLFAITAGLLMTRWFASTHLRPWPVVAVLVAPIAMWLGGGLGWLAVGLVPLVGAALAPRADRIGAEGPPSSRVPEIEPAG
jgi:hypothetical protein